MRGNDRFSDAMVFDVVKNKHTRYRLRCLRNWKIKTTYHRTIEAAREEFLRFFDEDGHRYSSDGSAVLQVTHQKPQKGKPPTWRQVPNWKNPPEGAANP